MTATTTDPRAKLPETAFVRQRGLERAQRLSARYD